jgi:hypothetical protein
MSGGHATTMTEMAYLLAVVVVIGADVVVAPGSGGAWW